MSHNLLSFHLLLITIGLLQCSAFVLSGNNRANTSLYALSRRDVLTSSTVAASLLFINNTPLPASAADVIAVPMKEFVDPKGLFRLKVPSRFFTIRRTTKGDLPDEQTGQGRRGSSIFTAGDLNKAEIVAVERYPVRALLEENGIDASGDLSNFSSLGKAGAIAELMYLRREKDKEGQISTTKLLKETVSVSEDDKSLYFRLVTPIDVQKPELLKEQMGVTELNRDTVVKATLLSNDGNIMAVYASALSQDFDGPDGEALQQCVDSFTVTDMSGAAASSL